MNTPSPISRQPYQCMIALMIAHMLGAGVALVVALTLSGPVWPAAARGSSSMLTVVNTNDNGLGSLRDALAHAIDGDTIAFNVPATSTIVLTSGELTVTKNIVIDGATAVNLTVSGNSASRVLSVTAPATFSAFTIANGNFPTGDGGGIASTRAITLMNMTFISNSAFSRGGGLHSDGLVQVSGTRFAGNQANYGGAVSVANAASLSGSLFQNNMSPCCNGGALYVTGTLALANTQFISNSANGAGAVWSLMTTTVDGGLLQSNSAYYDSGGIVAGYYGNGSIALTGTQFISNSVVNGAGGLEAGAATLIGGRFQGNQHGGLSVYTLTMTGTLIIDNSGGGAFARTAVVNGAVFENNHSANGSGGGLSVCCSTGNSATLQGTSFVSNSSGLVGGGLYVYGSATLNGTSFVSNSAGLGAGGLYVLDTATLNGTSFVGNSTAGSAGGMAAMTATVNGGLFADNRAGRSGGGLSVGALALTGTQFLGNSAALRGGGTASNGNTRIVNALFARNSTTGVGAALFLFYSPVSSGTAQILHTTIASPSVAGGAAIYVMTATVGVTDTLIASHSVGIENSGGSVYEDYNLLTGVLTPTAGGVTSGAHHPSGGAAFLNPAADNYHLWRGSAAIDTGVDAGVDVDVDGQPRPQGAGFDIGYDESSGTFQSSYLPLVQR